MDKKGDFTIQQLIQWTGYLLVFLVFFAAFYWIYSSAVRKEIDTSDITNDVYMMKFLSDSDCLAYDENGMVKTGVIDANKFSSDILDSCLKREGFSAKLILRYGNASMTIFNNEDDYGLDSRLCFSPKYKCESREFYVAINDDNKLYNGMINVSVVLNAA